MSDPMNVIRGLMTDHSFVGPHMPFMYDDGQLVWGSLSDAIYALRGEVDVAGILNETVERVADRFPDFLIGGGLAFVCSLPSTFPLPKGHMASRHVNSDNHVEFAVVASFPIKISFGESESRTGGSLLIFGILTEERQVDARLALDIGLAYLNDVITSYRIVRHDHGIQPIAPRQLPGTLDCYSIGHDPELTITPAEPFLVHHNDKTDIWSKRVLVPFEYKDFLMHCEGLAYGADVRYLLNLAVTSIDELCLGQFESAVLNSDRFMELALRLCYLRHPDLPPDKLGRLTSVYSPSTKTRTLLSVLTAALSINIETFLETWVNTSRRLRNAVAHMLDFGIVTPSGGHLAVEHNLALVHLIASEFPNDVKDVHALGNMIKTYERLFGSSAHRAGSAN